MSGPGGQIDRRSFFKVIATSGAAAAASGCSRPAGELYPYVTPPEKIVPGVATYFATTCRECPAGCGVLAKNRDGRVIKLEGNPTSRERGERSASPVRPRSRASTIPIAIAGPLFDGKSTPGNKPRRTSRDKSAPSSRPIRGARSPSSAGTSPAASRAS